MLFVTTGSLPSPILLVVLDEAFRLALRWSGFSLGLASWPVWHICNTMRFDLGDVFVYAMSRSESGRWLASGLGNRHPGSCGTVVDESTWPRRPPSPFRLQRWFETIGSQVTHRYCVVERRGLSTTEAH
jgi:hypothetical protein